MTAPQALRVYWRPGCSSCVKVKEFLAQLGVEYESVNVSANPRAMEELRALGVHQVPVVVRAGEYVFAQELADVSAFIGRKVDFKRLPAPVLVEKWLRILQAAQRHARQIPAQRLHERATPGRDRSVRDLAFHVYQVAEAFLEAVENGVEDLPSIYNAPPPQGMEIWEYGAAIEKRLRRWWARNPDTSGKIRTYYGAQPLHHVLERSTWHSAQHARQIMAVLERLAIGPEGPLTEEDTAGLPMPAGLWE
jgi:glutaredoxin/uncharacterized damage-inducible protein DinB